MAVTKKKAKKKGVGKKPKTKVKKQVKRAAKKSVKKAAGKKGGPREKAAKKAARKAIRPKEAPKAETPAKTPVATLKRKEHLIKLLLKKRNEIVEELEAELGRKLSRPSGQRIDSAMDNADMSSQDMDEGVTNSLLEMRYTQYKDIADAFRKLQNDTYGLCEECGAEIDIKRLEVNPFARYCVACKTRIEEFEKIQREAQRFKEQ